MIRLSDSLQCSQPRFLGAGKQKMPYCGDSREEARDGGAKPRGNKASEIAQISGRAMVAGLNFETCAQSIRGIELSSSIMPKEQD